MSNRPDIATLHKIAIEVQRLRTLAIKDGLESVAPGSYAKRNASGGGAPWRAARPSHSF
jgi:hypothetical protein